MLGKDRQRADKNEWGKEREGVEREGKEPEDIPEYSSITQAKMSETGFSIRSRRASGHCDNHTSEFKRRKRWRRTRAK
jgi:hypothetical protein